jgi:hypothetical protein
LDVERAARLGITQQQAAQSIFILRVFLDQTGILVSLEDFGIVDVALHDSLKGVTTEIKQACPEPMENLLEGFHI